MKQPTELLALVTASFLLGLTIANEPAKASDGGAVITVTSDDAPLPPTEGCNPYIVIHPPDLPPDASNLNGVTINLKIGDVCGHWRAKPQAVPALSLPKA